MPLVDVRKLTPLSQSVAMVAVLYMSQYR